MNKMIPYVVTVLIMLALVAFSSRCFAYEVYGGVKPALEPELDVNKLLESIRSVEDWMPYQYGARGERGPYQMLPSVWREYSRYNMEFYADRTDEKSKAEVYRVARAHALWILERIDHLGMPMTARSFGLMWTAGYRACRDKTTTKAKRNYADRVQNVYDSLK